MGASETVADAICRAVRSRHLLSFAYKGSVRTVEPYILGYDDKEALVLSAVQLSGGSGRGFRSFGVDGIERPTVTGQKFFRDHPDYNARDRFFTRILCQV